MRAITRVVSYELALVAYVEESIINLGISPKTRVIKLASTTNPI